ncbi:MAG TPA: NAD(P)-dependent alcohol dehydrogenase [Myxococcota bacterium]|nr:NAD(P)-dependent alcohol dehydrogenase [Myxococcota bacterium]
MRAIQYRNYGGSECLELVDLPKPTPKAGEMLVRVHCASVNPVDWKLASGKTRPILWVTPPAVPCFDLAGVVEELGAGVSSFATGDRVHARVTLRAGGGAAEYAVVPVVNAAKMPDSMPFSDAAAIPLAGMTALQALRNYAGMPLTGAGGRVLVVGAAGGAGHLGVQVAKAAGAHVTGVCSGKNVETVRALGADEVIDYSRPDAWQGKAPWDIVLDCVGQDLSGLMGRLSPGGKLACIMPGPAVVGRMLLNPVMGQKVYAVGLKANGIDLALLDQLYVAGKLKVLIEQHYPLEQLREAWERSMSGRVVGKLVVDVIGD